MISNVGSQQEVRQCGVAVRGDCARQPALHGALIPEEALTYTPINVHVRKQTYFPFQSGDVGVTRSPRDLGLEWWRRQLHASSFHRDLGNEQVLS